MLRRLSCYLLLLFPGCPLLAQSCTAPAPADSSAAFWRQQLRFPRVRAAQATAGPAVAARLRARALHPDRLEILFRLVKTDREVEVWARNHGGGPFALLHASPLAATSGTLGPKRRADDFQVPEGCYEIDRFNPNSNFLLSLGLNYPTATERALGEPDPGGDIFIHGGAATIGCLPITNAGIEEVYLLAVLARTAGQMRIPVHIFPFPITDAELARRAGSPHAAYWRGLRHGYAYFEQHHEPAPPAPPAALAAQ